MGQFKWCALKIGNDFYAVRGEKINGKNKLIYLHRNIMKPEKGFVVDHRDHNTLNCQRKNLRICTRNQNSQNNKGSSKKYKYKGIYYVKPLFINKGIRNRNSMRRWAARIRIKGKYKHIGVFFTMEEAAIAYNKYALISFGEYASLNQVI